jgi:hypothetical protein
VPLARCEALKVALIDAFPALARVLIMRVREPVSTRPMGDGVEPLEATRSRNSLQKPMCGDSLDVVMMMMMMMMR